ncbi:hypothetical protein F5Y03DRAFT_398112 [Xylaria venustula]|nr:hypothetical protein F5Y03DRAFT_398112 [Xylaria venustula]
MAIVSTQEFATARLTTQVKSCSITQLSLDLLWSSSYRRWIIFLIHLQSALNALDEAECDCNHQHKNSHPERDDGHASKSNNDVDLWVFASSCFPVLGRRIFTQSTNGNVSHHFATAGVVVQVGGRYYQLTAGHLFENQSEPSEIEPLPVGLEECHFDGQSDDDDDDDDDDQHGSGKELESKSLGSAKPEEASSLGRSLGDCSTSEITHNHNTEVREVPRQTHRYKELIGYLPRKNLSQSLVDYAIISLSIKSVEDIAVNINYVKVFHYLRLRGVAVPRRDSVVVITNTAAIPGTLILGKVVYRNPRTNRFDKLVQVILEGQLREGDCGSPVIDVSNGNFYGHVIMGVAGTCIAYIVPAVDIFRAISEGLGDPVSVFKIPDIPISTSATTQTEIMPYYNTISSPPTYEEYNDGDLMDGAYALSLTLAKTITPNLLNKDRTQAVPMTAPPPGWPLHTSRWMEDLS